MRAILRILVISVVAVVMTSTAYLMGFATSWFMTHDMGLADAAQAISQPSRPAASTEPIENFDLFWEVWDIVRQEFYGELPEEKEITYGAIRGALETLGDPNTLFIDPQTAELNRPDLEGEFDGIGAVVTMNEEGQLVVISPMEGQPAMKAGLKPGDIILEVDGKEITGMNLTEAVLLIRGPRGTTVRLTVLRPDTGETLEFEIVRATIETVTVVSRILEEAPEVGYIRLSMFGPNSVDELRKAIKDLQEQGAKAFILDIRNNPGGLLTAAIDITSQFVSDTVITTEVWSDGQTRVFEAKRGGLLTDPDIPLVVLVNKGSASASEILSGAIKDLKRGILVGEQTFGKGAVQQVYTLSDGSQLRVTVAHWLTPSGQDIHERGIEPDVVVPLTEEDIEARKDVQLERAIELIQEQLSGTS